MNDTTRRLMMGAAGGGTPTYVEDVFSTWLYTGNGSTQTIQNGIALGDNVINYLTGKTITNIGSAITLGSLSNVNDGILETTNGTNYAYTSGTLDIYVDMGAGFSATGYLIAPQGTTNSVVYNTIDGFIVKASNDASTWTTIQTFSGYDSTYPAWNAGSFRPFTFSNTTAYRYWRLQSTDASNDSLSEWALLSNSAGIGEGGMVWIKQRNGTGGNNVFDTARGAGNALITNATSASSSDPAFGSFSSSGFSLSSSSYQINNSGDTYASWTFRKAAKFFDVVTYVGDDVVGRTVSHNLGSAPGCMIIKRTDATGGWIVYHRSLGAGSIILLNSTGASSALGADYWNSTAPTSTVFTLGGGGAAPAVNASGATYVAYLFAHDAGGFGDSGNESVVKCGSYTGNGTSQDIELGWEPQWVLIKNSSATANWVIYDTMRGFLATSDSQALRPNLTDSEQTLYRVNVASTGFRISSESNALINANGNTYIYIAIRRGPMKTPTDATTVFSANTYAGGTAGRSFNLGFVPDALLTMRRNTSNFDILQSRLTGLGYMFTNDTAAEISALTGMPAWDADTETIKLTTATSVTGWNGSGSDYVNQVFRRAPGFFDVVAYTGTGSATTVSHNLGVAPELMITRQRTPTGGNWWTYHSAIGATGWIALNLDNATTTSSVIWNDTAPTSTVFSVGTGSNNTSSATIIAYLFATCPGVSKVGSYTGTGTTLNVDCGFTNGSRLVLIKRTDSTGDWYVWDTARGIVSGNDPYLLLNSTAAEVTSTDYIDPLSSGFQISSTAPAAINANGGSFVFLAVA